MKFERNRILLIILFLSTLVVIIMTKTHNFNGSFELSSEVQSDTFFSTSDITVNATIYDLPVTNTSYIKYEFIINEKPYRIRSLIERVDNIKNVSYPSKRIVLINDDKVIELSLTLVYDKVTNEFTRAYVFTDVFNKHKTLFLGSMGYEYQLIE